MFYETTWLPTLYPSSPRNQEPHHRYNMGHYPLVFQTSGMQTAVEVEPTLHQCCCKNVRSRLLFDSRIPQWQKGPSSWTSSSVERDNGTCRWESPDDHRSCRLSLGGSEDPSESFCCLQNPEIESTLGQNSLIIYENSSIMHDLINHSWPKI